MSVITKADEELKSAYAHIDGAIKNLSAIVVEQCWGAEDFSSTTRQEIADAFWQLVGIRNTLK